LLNKQAGIVAADNACNNASVSVTVTTMDTALDNVKLILCYTSSSTPQRKKVVNKLGTREKNFFNYVRKNL